MEESEGKDSKKRTPTEAYQALEKKVGEAMEDFSGKIGGLVKKDEFDKALKDFGDELMKEISSGLIEVQPLYQINEIDHCPECGFKQHKSPDGKEVKEEAEEEVIEMVIVDK